MGDMKKRNEYVNARDIQIDSMNKKKRKDKIITELKKSVLKNKVCQFYQTSRKNQMYPVHLVFNNEKKNK